VLGKFITIEGPDGGGKSSNVLTIVERLELAGYSVIQSREPGGTKIGEKLRAILLGGLEKDDRPSETTELLLFAAARAQHIDTKIKPALEAGQVVICDRFADSTYAYQGHARGLLPKVLQLQDFVHQGFEPDYTLFFDLTLEESQRRLAERAEAGGENNRLDQERIDFKTRAYLGYQECFNRNPHRMYRIDAMGSRDEVKREVTRWVEEVFIPQNPLP
jgi:dTMP kinase